MRKRGPSARPQGRGFQRRKSFTHLRMRIAASSISGGLNATPKLKRIAERTLSGAAPIASITGEGCRDPLEHADPVEQQTPARSSFIRSASAWQPGKERFSV